MILKLVNTIIVCLSIDYLDRYLDNYENRDKYSVIILIAILIMIDNYFSEDFNTIIIVVIIVINEYVNDYYYRELRILLYNLLNKWYNFNIRSKFVIAILFLLLNSNN